MPVRAPGLWHGGGVTDSSPRGGPLAGVRTVEFAGLGPAPFAGMLLADLGADVVCVERADGGSDLAQTPLLSRGRRSVVLDLKADAGREVARRLLAWADLLVEGFRPGVMERLGLGPEEAFAVNPRLVYGRVTGWGQDGPLARYAGHDLAYLALTGALAATARDPGDGTRPRPLAPGALLGDLGGGALHLVVGLLAALVETGRSGRGQVVDASVMDGTAYLTTFVHALRDVGFWNAPPGRNLLDSGAPFYEVYECADGRHLAVAALEDRFYAELLRLLDLDLTPEDPRHPCRRHDRATWPQAKAAWAALFATRVRDDWARLLQGSDACVAPVLDLAEVPEHPHVAGRAAYRRIGDHLLPAPSPRFSRTPATPGAVPQRGNATAAVLAELGYSPAQIAQLRGAGTVG